MERIKQIFQDALELPYGERPAFVESAAGADESLRMEIESLLNAHGDAEGYFEGDQTTAVILEPQHPDAMIGRIVGSYRLLREIGRGGMGSVYLGARADDEFRRLVAIKLVRLDIGSDFVFRRFRSERQILAGLDHPNIARLLDGGATPEGLPYFVMEYVEGQPIKEYGDSHRLSTIDRLKLFREVCSAVHYAHQNLIVHRDIKPGNILVTPDGKPKLLDFGIAKLLAPSSESGAGSEMTSRIMTPEYASPEQVRGEPITTASDVYSLGVLLFELLTGHRPYRTVGTSPLEIIKAVCEQEPEKPSAAVSRVETVNRSAIAENMLTPEAVSKARDTLPEKLQRQLKGDLDNIVLKAMKKEPQRRYASVEQLSEDIRRYLDGLPVIARKDTFSYRAGKFVRRHRWGVAGAVVIALSLIAAAAVTGWQALVAKRERAKAERRFNDVRRLANSFMFDIHDEIRDLAGSTRARQRLVATAKEYLDGLANEAEGDLGLERELAAAYERLGDVQGGRMSANLGESDSAFESYRKALTIREAIVSGGGADPRDIVELSRLELLMGILLRGMGRLPDAEASFRSVTERLEAVVASGRPPEDVRSGLGDAYQKLAEVQESLGLSEVARRSMEKAVEYGEAFCRDHPENLEAQSTLAATYYVDSLGLRKRGDYQEALRRVRQARAIQEALLQKDPLNQRNVRSLLFSLNGESLHLDDLGERREAVQVLHHAVEVAEDMRRRDPQDRWAQAAVTVAYSALGRGLMGIGDNAAALTPLRTGREIGARVVAEDPANGFVRNELAIIDANLGFALLGIGTTTSRRDACHAFARSLETLKRLKAEGPLPAPSVTALRNVEDEIARCGGRSAPEK